MLLIVFGKRQPEKRNGVSGCLLAHKQAGRAYHFEHCQTVHGTATRPTPTEL
ncbi:MAG: hypothetical protein Q4A85_00955 [Kingella sp. (in: b-proteobacteria)]|nr:hypothetical protein [Kingella sp. (in: b-proteobacteria)]